MNFFFNLSFSKGTTMLRFCIVLILFVSVSSESQVRETETWMPMKTTQMAAMSTHDDHLGSSGDFGFTDDDSLDYSDYYTDDEDEYNGFSGSGDGVTTVSPGRRSRPSVKPDVNDNKIPEPELPVRPTINEVDVVQKSNEIPLLRNGVESDKHPSNVLMAHASEESIFSKKEVLAALIAGGAVGLMFAIIPIALLIYCMKKKDEGSYDLGKKPIYKKAPTAEIYA